MNPSIVTILNNNQSLGFKLQRYDTISLDIVHNYIHLIKDLAQIEAIEFSGQTDIEMEG